MFSDSANHVAMMQIDCEVINTSLVQISEDAIPIHLNVRMKSEPKNPKPSSNSTLERNESRSTFGHDSLKEFEKPSNISRYFEN